MDNRGKSYKIIALSIYINVERGRKAVIFTTFERVDKVGNALGEGTFPSPNRTPQSALRRGLSRMSIRLAEQDAMHMSSVSPL